MKTFYEKRLLDNAEPNLVHDQLAELDGFAAILGNGVFIRKLVMDEIRLRVVQEQMCIRDSVPAAARV